MSVIDKTEISPDIYSKESGLHPNTDLGFDVKTLLQSNRLTKVGDRYEGVLLRDDEYHYTFIETLPITVKRNAHLFNGDHITLTVRDDGSLRLNFRPMQVTGEFNIDSYALGVCDEIRTALRGLIEK